MRRVLRQFQYKLYYKVKVLRRLDWRRDGWLFLRMLSLAAVTPLLMQRHLPVVQAWLSRTAAVVPVADQIDRRLRCMNLIMALGRPFIQPRCLTRGVTLYHFLRRAGLPVELHFGVQHRGTFTAHCWLELEGEPFAEPNDPTREFTMVYTLR